MVEDQEQAVELLLLFRFRNGRVGMTTRDAAVWLLAVAASEVPAGWDADMHFTAQRFSNGDWPEWWLSQRFVALVAQGLVIPQPKPHRPALWLYNAREDDVAVALLEGAEWPTG